MLGNTSVALNALVAVLLTGVSFPQATKAANKENNLYEMALRASIVEMQKEWGRIDDSYQGSRVRTDYQHVLVRKYPEITDELPSEFEGHQVQYLDDRALIEKYQTLKKQFSIMEVHPIHNEGTRLRIQVSVSWFEYKKNGLWFGLSDWSNVEFQFDCEEQQYVITAMKLEGI